MLEVTQQGYSTPKSHSGSPTTCENSYNKSTDIWFRRFRRVIKIPVFSFFPQNDTFNYPLCMWKTVWGVKFVFFFFCVRDWPSNLKIHSVIKTLRSSQHFQRHTGIMLYVCFYVYLCKGSYNRLVVLSGKFECSIIYTMAGI